jgi:hypothetical protein
MKKLIFAAGLSIAALTMTVPAQAQERTIGGAVAGGVAGGIIAGPVGVVVGGVTGAFIGDSYERRCWTNNRGRRVCSR